MMFITVHMTQCIVSFIADSATHLLGDPGKITSPWASISSPVNRDALSSFIWCHFVAPRSPSRGPGCHYARCCTNRKDSPTQRACNVMIPTQLCTVLSYSIRSEILALLKLAAECQQTSLSQDFTAKFVCVCVCMLVHIYTEC